MKIEVGDVVAFSLDDGSSEDYPNVIDHKALVVEIEEEHGEWDEYDCPIQVAFPDEVTYVTLAGGVCTSDKIWMEREGLTVLHKRGTPEAEAFIANINK